MISPNIRDSPTKAAEVTANFSAREFTIGVRYVGSFTTFGPPFEALVLFLATSNSAWVMVVFTHTALYSAASGMPMHPFACTVNKEAGPAAPPQRFQIPAPPGSRFIHPFIHGRKLPRVTRSFRRSLRKSLHPPNRLSLGAQAAFSASAYGVPQPSSPASSPSSERSTNIRVRMPALRLLVPSIHCSPGCR